MGVYGVRPGGEVFKITDETGRTWTKLNDDSRVRMADDLDIAPDGKIYFSDCTTRYEASNYPLEIVEGRPNGRVLCYDPATGKTRKIIKSFYFPNGVCVAHDGRSVLIASTTDCRIYRHWLAGPRSGMTEILIDGTPGHPDNINRASDGNYWLALIGIRTPSFDLSMRKAAFRRRMAKQVPLDEWLGPNLNYGCVVKFDEAGNVLEFVLGPNRRFARVRNVDPRAQRLSLSRRTAKQSDRTHSHRRRRSDLDRLRGLLGRQAAGITHMSFLTHLRRDLEQILFKDRDPHAIPSMDGAFTPNDRLDSATPIGEPLEEADAVAEAPDGSICVSAGNTIWRLSGAGYQDRAVLAEFDSKVGALAFDRDGRLLACTARGLAALDGAGRTIDVLEQVEGERLGCLTAVASGPDGAIFLSDGGSRHCAEDWRVDLMEGAKLGRIVACGPTFDDARVLLRGLNYPAGLAATDGHLWFAESFAHRMSRAPLDRARRHRRARGRDPQHARLSIEAGRGPRRRLLAQLLCAAHAFGRVRSARGRFPRRDDAHDPSGLLGCACSEQRKGLPRAVASRRSESAWNRETLGAAAILWTGRAARWGGEVVETLHSRVGGRHHGVTAAIETAQAVVLISKGGGRVLLHRSDPRQ